MKQETGLEKFFNVFLLVLISIFVLFNAASLGGVKTISFYFGHLFSIVIGFVWLLKMICTRKIRLLKSYSLLFVIAFMLYATGYYLVSDIPYYARNELFQIFDYACIFIVIINSFHRTKYQYALSFVLLGGAVVFASLGSMQYFKNYDNIAGIGFRAELIKVEQSENEQLTLAGQTEAHTAMGTIVEAKPDQYAGRASGTWVCPNHLSGFLEMIFPIGIALCLFSRLSMGIRLLLGYASIVTMVGWVLTFSRGGWLAGAAGLISIFAMAFLREDSRGKNWVLPCIVIAILLTMCALFIPPVKERVMTIRPGADSSITTRMKIWDSAVTMIKQSPVFGYGPAAFAWKYPPYKNPTLKCMVTYTHNDYLNALVDYGIVGGLIIAAFMIYLLLRVTLISKLYDYPDNQAILLGALGGLVTIFVHAAFDFNNHIYSNAVLFMVVAGLIVVSSIPHEFLDEFSWRFRWINRSIVLLLLVGLGVTLCLTGAFVQGYRVFKSDMYAREAEVLQSNIFWDKALDRLEKARKLDPVNPKIYDEMATINASMAVFRRDSQINYTEKALELYNTSIRYNPYESDFMFKKALLLKRLGQSQEAYETLEYAIEQEPTNSAYIKQFKALKSKLDK